MAGKPSSYINWTSGQAQYVVQPPAGVAAIGWQDAEAPPAEYMNWLFYTLDQWVQYLDEIVEPGVPDQAIRLINGGIYTYSVSANTLSISQDLNISFPGVPDSNNRLPAGTFTINDGEIIYVTVNTPIITQGTTGSGSNVITNLNFVGNLEIGMAVTGPGIPSSTTILGIGTSSVTISNNATSDNTNATYIFSNSGTLTAVNTPNDTFVPTFNTIIIARRVGSQCFIGVNADQMVLNDGEFKSLLGSGYFSYYSAPAGQALTQGQAVYISPGPSADQGRTAGAFYPLDTSAANQAVRGTFSGVVISNFSSGSTATVVYEGFLPTSGLTPGQLYFSDPTTPGGIVASEPQLAGSKRVIIGFSTAANVLLVNASTSIGGSFTQPIFGEAKFFGNSSQTAFVLSTTPLSDIACLVFLDGIPQVLGTDWSLSGSTINFTTAPATGQDVYVKFILAGQAYLQANQQVPTGIINGSNTSFKLASQPINKAALTIFGDVGPIDPATWSLTLNSDGSTTIVFTTAPTLATSLYAYWLSPVGTGAGGSSGLSGGGNVGTGVPVLYGVSGSTINFKTLTAGVNVNITDDGLGNLTVSAAAAAYTRNVFGSGTSPDSINPTVGISPSTDMDQTWYVVPTTTGASPITANPQIAAGVTLGQRITLKGGSAFNYLTLADGNGLDLSGPKKLTNNDAITLEWNGVVWSENSRRG